MRNQDDVLELLTFIGGGGGAQLDPTQDLAQHHSHFDHGEAGAEAAAVAAAERQPGGRAQGGTQHPIRVESVRIRILLGAGVYQPHSGATMTPAGSR